ncbi:MAG: kinase [Elusimicrobia bacterium CG_4_9_14_3_um_filter_62_55]|nr:MAG: kinase [Elusimicrobia bacterium CG22_combo_CG10-13_8_21_14_all_63_91]PJA15921.1 MAG: kinase [Elusimicrobia bacterium CG_4_10_14_0_2_um_filter_63_34]PJB25011.1 MAG: kinase [Elusimicrobia bacterium CG_4_9_14_3_um_filter_62_55]
MAMIVTRTPFRVSFLGGGSDIEEWFSRHGGAVLSTAVDKYCYVTVRDLPPYFDYSIRVSYSRVETVGRLANVRHPLVREALRLYRKRDVEVHYDADLPGRSGLGTSSAFAVGLLSALENGAGRFVSKRALADKAIHLERRVLKERGGWQDQIAVAFGGLNHVRFSASGYTVEPVCLDAAFKKTLIECLHLVYIPTRRISGKVSFSNRTPTRRFVPQLRFLQDSVEEGIRLLKDQDIQGFGALMHECWLRKRTISRVSNAAVDAVYRAGLRGGALGGKLLGAGAGGYMLFVCRPTDAAAFKRRIHPLNLVPIRFDDEGTSVIYYSTGKGA